MNEDTQSPREAIGGNLPPTLPALISEAAATLPEDVERWLKNHKVYGPLVADLDELLAEARELTIEEVDGKDKLRSLTDDDDKGRVAALVKKFRDFAKRAEGLRELEKTPYLRGGNVIDQFFLPLIEKCLRRDKKQRPGAADVLMGLINAYDDAVEAARRAELEKKRIEEERVAREAKQAAEKAAREAEEREREAARARAPKMVEQKSAAAEEAEKAAAVAAQQASAAVAQATESRLAANVSSADLMRTRHETGVLSTRGTEKYAEVVDDTLLDKDKLWPFIKLEAKEQALRAWAQTTGHSQKMAGAEIGTRAKSQVR